MTQSLSRDDLKLAATEASVKTLPGAFGVAGIIATIWGAVFLIGSAMDHAGGKVPLFASAPWVVVVVAGVALMVWSSVLLKRRFLSLASGSGLTATDAEKLWREADEDDAPRQNHKKPSE